MGLAGMTLFNAFNNVYRMIYYCGNFDVEADWCRWPYGSLAAVEQVLCFGLCLYTTISLINLNPETRFSIINRFWAFLAFSSLLQMFSSLYIISERFPSYWMAGMRSDIWSSYAKFWLCVIMVILIHSIAVLRLAGGTGAEAEHLARELIYSNLAHDKQDGAESEAESLANLFGSGQQDDDVANSSLPSLGTTTPLDNGSVLPMHNQAMDGFQMRSRGKGNN
jgi:hypothetical protein